MINKHHGSVLYDFTVLLSGTSISELVDYNIYHQIARNTQNELYRIIIDTVSSNFRHLDI